MSPRRIGVGVLLAGVLAGCQAANTPEILVRAERNLEVSRGQLQRELDQRKESLGLMGASLTGCSLERRQAYELDAEQESALGQAVAARQLATLSVEPLPATDPVARYVDQVGQYLALVAAAVGNSSGLDRAGRPERALNNRPWPHAGYQFRVLPLEEARATGGPGGIVMISTGFLRSLESEEELAAVLAHEVAHVQRGHGVEAIKAAMCDYEARQESSASLRAFGQRIKLQRETAASGSPPAQERVPGELLRGAAEEAVNLYREGFLEDFELEADRITVRILMGAGYDARAFTGLIQRLSLEAPAKHPWRRMHPPPRERVAAVDERITALGPTQVMPPPDAVDQRKKRFLDAMGALPGLTPEPQASHPPP
jgi:predicted Zn-dependent protease